MNYWRHCLQVITGLMGLLLAAVSGCVSIGLPVQANDQAPGSRPDRSAAREYFTDTILLDQDGHQVRFYTDILQGKVVVINSFFSSCTDSCPVMTATLARIQDWLGDRLGRDARIVSITVDPLTDTPPVLKEYSSRVKARPGWSFLTGKPEDVEIVLRKLGQFVDSRDDHLNIFIVGNERTGLWKKAFGLARPREIIEVVDSVLGDRN